MDVEIDNQDPLEAVVFAGMGGRNRHIVEQAEAHRGLGECMMSGRAAEAQCFSSWSLDHRINGCHSTSCSLQRHGVGVGGDDRVGLNASGVELTAFPNETKMRWCVDPLELGGGCGTDFTGIELFPDWSVRKLGGQIPEPFRGLGMVSGQMFLKTGVGVDERLSGGRHAGNSTQSGEKT
jgi:hypothetical protein